MKLRPVGIHDWQFLYDLLAERPVYANISHRHMPDIGDHVAFLRSNPYQAWYIIEVPDKLHNLQPAGSIYLTKQNEIGIHVQASHQRTGLATEAIQELMRLNPRPHYLANISPMNFPSAKLFMGLGFQHIQNTYELRHGSTNP